MTIDLEWLVEGRVCLIRPSETVTVDDLKQIDARLLEYLDAATQPVHLLVDARSVRHLPPLQHVIKVGHTPHPHQGQSLLVGLMTNPIARFVMSLVSQFSGDRYKSFTTMEEAYAYLRQTESLEV